MASTPRIDRLEENILINGGMRIAQRSLGPTAVLPTYVSVDRWYVYDSGTTSPLSRRTGPIGYASSFISNYTHGMNATINAATDTLGMGQRVEASRLRSIMAGENKISLSCKVAPSVDAEVEVLVRYNNDGEDLFSGSKTIVHQQNYAVGSGTIEVKVEDLDLPDIAMDNGIEVNFTVTNWSSTGAQFVDMSDAMLNPGSRVAEFNERDLTTELALCQRYFEKSYDLDVAPGTAQGGGELVQASGASGANNFQAVTKTSQFKVTKRATPTGTIYQPVTGAAGVMRRTVDGVSISATVQTTQYAFSALNNVATLDTRIHNWHWTADAEL